MFFGAVLFYSRSKHILQFFRTALFVFREGSFRPQSEYMFANFRPQKSYEFNETLRLFCDNIKKI